MIRLLVAAWLVFALSASAQDGTLKCFAVQDGTGTTDTINVCKGKNQSCPPRHTVQVVTTGSPSGCEVALEGSLDGSNFFALSTTDDTSAGDCTASVMWHTTNRPVRWIRGNVTALSGGTTPTVRICYLGGF